MTAGRPRSWGSGRAGWPGWRQAGTHLHLGNQQQLLLDAQEDRVEGQLVGLLVEPQQCGLGRRQQAVAAGPFLLGGDAEAVREARTRPQPSAPHTF